MLLKDPPSATDGLCFLGLRSHLFSSCLVSASSRAGGPFSHRLLTATVAPRPLLFGLTDVLHLSSSAWCWICIFVSVFFVLRAV